DSVEPRGHDVPQAAERGEGRARRTPRDRADGRAAVDDQAPRARPRREARRRLPARDLRARARRRTMTRAGVHREARAAAKLRSSADIEKEAMRRLPPFLAEYIAGGSYAEHTLRRNVEDLASIELRQRVLCDV